MRTLKKDSITTAKDFEIFKKEAELWIKRLGLVDWSIYFSHVGDCPNALASMMANIPNRGATINLSADWTGEGISVSQLRETAFHEVLELVLARLSYLGECRFLQDEEIPEERHNIIRRFENLFYGSGKKKKEMSARLG